MTIPSNQTGDGGIGPMDPFPAGPGPASPQEAGRPQPIVPSAAPDDSSGRSTADTAKDQARVVTEAAADAGSRVADTVKQEVQDVVELSGREARGLLDEAREQLQAQASTQQQNVAAGLHGLAEELGEMASSSRRQGVLSDLAGQGAAKGTEIAEWLERHEPLDVLQEVQSFARRRPVLFLAACGLAGVAAGRIARAMGDNAGDEAAADLHDAR